MTDTIPTKKRSREYAGITLKTSDNALLQQLPVQMAKAIQYASAGMKMHEMAEAMGVREGTAKSRLNRARGRLVELRASAVTR